MAVGKASRCAVEILFLACAAGVWAQTQGPAKGVQLVVDSSGHRVDVFIDGQPFT